MMRLLEKELIDVFLAAESVFAKLTAWRGERLAVETLSAALDQLVTRIDELYRSGAFRVFQVDEITALYGHRDALLTLGTTLADLQSAFQQFSDVRTSVEAQRLREERQGIDRSWIIAGIKAGLAVAVSLVVIEWLHPPGGMIVPSAAWVAIFVTTTGTPIGDLRLFSALCAYQSVCRPELFGIPQEERANPSRRRNSPADLRRDGSKLSPPAENLP